MSQRLIRVVQNEQNNTAHSSTCCGMTIDHNTGRITLSCHRHYPNLRNKLGGTGLSVPTSHNGLECATSEEADRLLLKYGYTRPYYGS